jgi:signal transduction histidine kinase
VYRFQVNKLLEMERLRTRIASDLHDDIGSGLTRIAVLSDVASVQILSLVGAQPGDAGGTEDEHGVTMAVQKVGNIARELVDAMSDVVWSIDPRHESAETLVQRIRAYAYELCEAKGMSLAFEAAGAAEATKLSPETLRGILLFTKEAVTNIVRHSRGTSAAIRVKFGRKQIHIEVSDDGRGFDPASVRAGNGLANMRSRAEKAGGSFAVTTGGSGTTLSIVLPIV